MSLSREEGGLQPLSDCFVYDTVHNVWEEPEVIGGNKFRARNAHTLTTISGNKAVAHGGWNPFVETYNDTFEMTVE